MDLAFSLAGLVVGLAVGATGVGGGSLMTPILILFYGISPSVAVGTDLIYASISKAFGVTLHSRNGSLDWKLVGWLSIGSVPAALLTLVFLHEQAPGKGLDQMIKLTLSVAIVLTALFTVFQDRIMALIRRAPGRAGGTEDSRWQRPMTVVSGVAIGALVTISSVGAGVIGMMMLLLLYPKQSPIRLVGSDLAHAVLITAIAGAGHASLGSVDWPMLGALLIGAIPGIYIGTRIGFRLDPKALKKVISALLIFVGSTMLWKAMH
ncbi:sulfite exporter TauE/SafE family protein [Hydrocarboniphaga sp.]|uniref:sulfite exporter TauE/SafE family protein n=1 Tax=Hydrocarboniphaga sp. TaxID=2033016 RepID=UPI003D0EE975